jgi:hypothetical protein
MPRLIVERVVERHTEYEIEVLVKHQHDTHRIGAVIQKPITLAKVQAAIVEVINNMPPTGDSGIASYWEGYTVEIP